ENKICYLSCDGKALILKQTHQDGQEKSWRLCEGLINVPVGELYIFIQNEPYRNMGGGDFRISTIGLIVTFLIKMRALLLEKRAVIIASEDNQICGVWLCQTTPMWCFMSICYLLRDF